MSSMENNAETYVEDDSDHDQGLGAQALCNVPPNLGGMSLISPELVIL